MSPAPSHLILMSPLDCRCAHTHTLRTQACIPCSTRMLTHVTVLSVSGLPPCSSAYTQVIKLVPEEKNKLARPKGLRALRWQNLLEGFNSPNISSGVMSAQLKCPLSVFAVVPLRDAAKVVLDRWEWAPELVWATVPSDLITVFPCPLSTLSLSCSLPVPVTEAVVRRHSWGKPTAVTGMPSLKCGTQQATLLSCGAGMVSTKRSCWACGGVGNLACEAPAVRKRRDEGAGNVCALNPRHLHS